MVIIEKYMHAFALLFGIATATTALVLNLYEDANWDCWISPTAQTFQWAFFFAPLWIAIIFVITCMLMIFLHVRTVEKNSIRRGRVSGREVQLIKTRAVAKQGALQHSTSEYFPSHGSFPQLQEWSTYLARNSQSGS